MKPDNTNQFKSGFEPAPVRMTPCVHPSHNPPMQLYIPPGQQYRHICPQCGYTIVLQSNQPFCGS